MKKFIVRKSLDYSIAIDAESEEGACNKAEKIPDDNWGADWSELEAEEE